MATGLIITLTTKDFAVLTGVCDLLVPEKSVALRGAPWRAVVVVSQQDQPVSRAVDEIDAPGRTGNAVRRLCRSSRPPTASRSGLRFRLLRRFRVASHVDLQHQLPFAGLQRGLRRAGVRDASHPMP